jgi:hypothetical protein
MDNGREGRTGWQSQSVSGKEEANRQSSYLYPRDVIEKRLP